MRKCIVNEEESINLLVITEEDTLYIKKCIEAYKRGNKSKIKEEFLRKYGIIFTNIIQFGKTEEVSSMELSKIIPERRYPSAPKGERKTYHCYASNNPIIPLHECSKSAWNCLMNTLGNPEHVLIYKSIEDNSYININKEAEEISKEELEAASDYYDKLKNEGNE